MASSDSAVPKALGSSGGMTKREEIASRVLASMLAAMVTKADLPSTAVQTSWIDKAADLALKAADSLISKGSF